MKDQEIWKDIPGYEGYYEASTLGRVRSIPRMKRCKNLTSYFKIPGAIKNPYPQQDGYLQIGLSKDGKKTSFLLHRLIGLVFIPGDTSLEINHIDFDRTNCRVSNLEWSTRQENVGYSYSNRRYDRKYVRGVKTKLKLSDIIEIRTLRRIVTQPIIAKRYGVSVGTISSILRGKYWKWA